jgi:hypothetical protein
LSLAIRLFVLDFYRDQFLARMGAERLSREPPAAGVQLPSADEQGKPMPAAGRRLISAASDAAN